MAYLYEKFTFLDEDFYKCIKSYDCDSYEYQFLYDFFVSESCMIEIPFAHDLCIDKTYLFKVAPLCHAFLDDQGEAPHGWDKETCFKVLFSANTVAEFMCSHSIVLEDLECGYFKRQKTEVV